MERERKVRGARLTPDQQWQACSSWKPRAHEHQRCRGGRRWGISSYQLQAIRSKPKNGSLKALTKDRAQHHLAYDSTHIPTGRGMYNLIPAIDGRTARLWEATSDPRRPRPATAWDRVLASEGLYAQDTSTLPVAFSDRGLQMTSRSTRQPFNDLGVTQTFFRPRTPADNASFEAWMATIKCERLPMPIPPRWHPGRWSRWWTPSWRTITHHRLHPGIGFRDSG